MRVIWRIRQARRDGDDRGAVMIFMVAFFVAAFGITALVIDLGSTRNARRRLVTSTDAAALAAADAYSLGEDGCTDVDANSDGTIQDSEKSPARKQLEANDSAAVMVSCTAGAGSHTGSGYVTVKATEDVDYTFGPVVGVDGATAKGTTIVRYGRPSGAGGLRPIGLCNENPALQAWIAAGTPTPSIKYQIKFEENANYCGNPEGNWGMLDMDGGSNGTSTFRDWVTDGYGPAVSVGDVIEGEPGAPAPSSDLDLLVGQLVDFPIVKIVGTGSGSNVTYEVLGFVSARIEHVQIVGGQALRRMDLKFHARSIGTCCASGPFTGSRSMYICSVDDSTANCT